MSGTVGILPSKLASALEDRSLTIDSAFFLDFRDVSDPFPDPTKLEFVRTDDAVELPHLSSDFRFAAQTRGAKAGRRGSNFSRRIKTNPGRKFDPEIILENYDFYSFFTL